MIVSDNTIKAERLGDFLKNLAEKEPNVSEKISKKDLRNSGRDLEIGANAGCALASRSP